MSNIYNLEPPTKGKVTLKTTLGDLDIELWPKEAPKAVRNFVQLCLEGYYDGVIFHRVIKDFMAQTGDPTGTGDGGECVYGTPFKDEFHSRLKFNHRGLVACANANAPHTNGSQFFITLDKCEWLDRKNTIFGKIVGDTLYNMLRLNDLEVDEATDRPTDPPVILSAEVMWNPFEDIVPRTTPAECRAQAQFAEAEQTRKVRKSQKRKLELLSFGDEAEAEEADAVAAAAAAPRIKSAHEVLRGDAALLAADETPEEVLLEQQQRAAALTAVQGKLRGGSKAVAAAGGSGSESDDGGGYRRRKETTNPGGGAAELVAQRMRAAEAKADTARAARQEAGTAGVRRGRSRSRSRSRSHSPSRGKKRSSSGVSDSDSSRSRSRSRGRRRDSADVDAEQQQQQSHKQPRSAEDELYDMRGKKMAATGRVRVTDDVPDAELLKAFELSRAKYKSRKQQVGNRQKDTLAKLAAFTDKLRTAKQPGQKTEQPAQSEQQQQQQQTEGPKSGTAGDDAYDGKVRTDIDHRAYMPAAWRVDEYLAAASDDDEDDGGGGLQSLRAHRLEFSKTPADANARRDELDDYVVHDPLLEAAKGKFSRAAQKEKKRTTTAWAGRGQG